MYYLYYAGMAANRSTEQIGLATSHDGIRYERSNGNGLLLAVDPRSTWKDERVCNPTVLHFKGEWLMFYQGAHVERTSGATTHAIGVARSSDGLVWTCEKEPVLSIDHMRRIQDGPAGNGGVIEPSILVDGDQLRMWFLSYAGSYRVGTKLYAAASADGGRSWTIDARPILSSHQLGRFSIHYPQVVRSATGLALWFTVRDYDTAACAICRMTLNASSTADELVQLLPPAPAGLRLSVRRRTTFEINGRMPRGVATLNLLACRLVDGGRHYFGYAHSHLIDPDAEETRLYYHGYHYDQQTRGPWMDIGSCMMRNGHAVGPHAAGLQRSPDPQAWDSFFVADPFVVRTNG